MEAASLGNPGRGNGPYGVGNDAQGTRLALWDETSDQADETAAERSSWLEGVVTGGSGWYRLDTTSVPPVYVLQRRPANSCFADGHCWQRSVEQPLHTILERAASQAALPPEALLKYTASATHQEIVTGARWRYLMATRTPLPSSVTSRTSIWSLDR